MKENGINSYLRHKNRIRPTILHRQTLRRPIHNPHTFQSPLTQYPTHISMRLDRHDLEPFLASSKRLGEFASTSSEVNDAGTALSGYATLLEEVLDGGMGVGGAVGVVGGGVGEAGLGEGAEGGHVSRCLRCVAVVVRCAAARDNGDK